MNKQKFKLQVQFNRVFKSETMLKISVSATCIERVVRLPKGVELYIDLFRMKAGESGVERQRIGRWRIKNQDREFFLGESLAFQTQVTIDGLTNRSDIIVELVSSDSPEVGSSVDKLAGTLAKLRVRQLDFAPLEGLDVWQAESNHVLPFNGLKNLARRNNIRFNARQDDGLLDAIGEKNLFTPHLTLPNGRVLGESWDFEFKPMEGETLRRYPESIVEIDRISELEIRKADWPPIYDTPSFTRPGAEISIKLIHLKAVSLVVGEKGYVIFRGNKVLRESAGLPLFDPDQYPVAEVNLEVGAWCGGRTKHNNIYHALLDDAARGWLIRRHVGDATSLFFPSYSIPYCLEVQEKLLGGGLTYLQMGVRYDFEELYLLNLSANGFGSPAVGFDEGYLGFVRERLPAKQAEPYHRKIYISRKDAATRRISNEDALRALLEGLGFITIVMTHYSPEQQRALFQHAECIVAEHGASLTNLVFCRPGTVVLELFSPIKASLAYAKLSVLLKFNYRAFVGDTIFRSGVAAGWQVDLKRIESVLGEILDRDSAV